MADYKFFNRSHFLIFRAVTVLILALAPAHAFDGEKAAEEYYVLQAECRIGETVTGIELTAQQASQQCEKRNQLGEALIANGYCWDNDEQMWMRCGG